MTFSERLGIRENGEGRRGENGERKDTKTPKGSPNKGLPAVEANNNKMFRFLSPSLS